MDFDVEEAFSIANETYHRRLEEKKEKSRQTRAFHEDASLIPCTPLLDTSSPPLEKNTQICVDPTMDVDIQQYGDDEIRAVDSEFNQSSPYDVSGNNDYNSVSVLSIDDSVQTFDINDSTEPLHAFTSLSTDEYCERIAYVFRKAHLSKEEHQNFLDLIREALPFPNSLPLSMQRLLSLIQVEDNLFEKKKMCVLCCGIVSIDTGLCSVCPDSNEAKTAFVYNSNVKFLLSLLLNRHWVDIQLYKQEIRIENDISGTFDIGFGQSYRTLSQSSSAESFITGLFHLDGISLCESSKWKLWLLSFSIVELPAKIRYQRFNMPVVSMWISSSEPVASTWLESCVKALEGLKNSGIVVNGEVIKLKIIGITGDSPALKIALNFIAHNGYFCCYFCFLRGIHSNGKRQYPYDSSIELRTSASFARDSKAAAQFNRNEKGHLGACVFSKILDVPLPHSIIIDYAHASLLRHSKAIFTETYRRLSPVIRENVDNLLLNQRFPHFFHRKMKSLKDLSFIKSTEVRNILFYGFLPIFHQFLPVNLISHFALFITSMRLFHGRPLFADQTSNVGNELIKRYCEDFSKFYIGLENFVLHLHLHYKTQYDNFGAFAHLGSFGQEDLIGYMGSNFTGTRYHGDLISENYSLDFMLHYSRKYSTLSDKMIDGAYDPIYQFDFEKKDIFIELHVDKCGCMSINTCLSAFRRCRISGRVYHSVNYHRRQKSVSYLVRYFDSNHSTDYLFGQIVMFIRVRNFTYALLQQYPRHCLFSDSFHRSPYHALLREPIDRLFYVVATEHIREYELIPIDRISEHCIFFNCVDYCIVTPVSSYDEHD